MILYFYQKNFYSMIVEEEAEYTNKRTCEQLLSDMCLIFGTTLEGRKQAISLRLQIVQMVPILISEAQVLMFFPITNGNQGYWWLNYQEIKDIKRVGEDCMIKFICGKELLLNVNHRSLKKQIHRCQLYEKILLKDNLEQFLSTLRGVSFD